MRVGLFHLLQWHEAKTQEQVYREAIEQNLRAEAPSGASTALGIPMESYRHYRETFPKLGS